MEGFGRSPQSSTLWDKLYPRSPFQNLTKASSPALPSCSREQLSLNFYLPGIWRTMGLACDRQQSAFSLSLFQRHKVPLQAVLVLVESSYSSGPSTCCFRILCHVSSSLYFSNTTEEIIGNCNGTYLGGFDMNKIVHFRDCHAEGEETLVESSSCLKDRPFRLM